MSNVNKPVIPAEVADAIEEQRRDGATNRDILIRRERIGKYHLALMSVPYDTLLAALVNGYERELTEEQRREKALAEIAAEYLRHESGEGDFLTTGQDAAYSEGIAYVLEKLGIALAGVEA